MTLLLEANMVDGEEAATLNSGYVQASCLVTSRTDTMSFKAGETVHRCVLFGFHTSFHIWYSSLGFSYA